MILLRGTGSMILSFMIVSSVTGFTSGAGFMLVVSKLRKAF